MCTHASLVFLPSGQVTNCKAMRLYRYEPRRLCKEASYCWLYCLGIKKNVQYLVSRYSWMPIRATLPARAAATSRTEGRHDVAFLASIFRD